MTRQDFYQKVTVSGIQELDFLNNSLSSIVLQNRTGLYTVTQGDLLRPELISYKVYSGQVQWWWFICLVNGIQNPFTDLFAGQVLVTPSTMDLYSARKSVMT